jgi:endonuclease/exonuclease/phosphatase family metal-dependent hydrolase
MKVMAWNVREGGEGRIRETWLRLDYVFASPELAPALESAGVVADGLAASASDHLPVWAAFG